MTGHLFPLLCLMASADAAPAKDIQRDGVGAIWFAPMLQREAVAPVAGQVGVQLGHWAMITASYGELPIANIRVSTWTVGARWYLSEAALAPFLAADYGRMTQEQDDTGGLQDRYVFGSMGAGLEKVWAHHFSLSSDLQAGPGRRESGSYHDATWLFWMQVRVAVGLRF
jgi:hypothetical protein